MLQNKILNKMNRPGDQLSWYKIMTRANCSHTTFYCENQQSVYLIYHINYNVVLNYEINESTIKTAEITKICQHL